MIRIDGLAKLLFEISYVHFSLKNLIFIDYIWDLTSCNSCNCNLISHSVRFYPNLKICSSRKVLKIFFWLIFTSAHKTPTMKCGSNFFPEMWFLNLLLDFSAEIFRKMRINCETLKPLNQEILSQFWKLYYVHSKF